MGERQAPIPSAPHPAVCGAPTQPCRYSCLDVITPHIAEGQEVVLPRPCCSLPYPAAFSEQASPTKPILLSCWLSFHSQTRGTWLGTRWSPPAPARAKVQTQTLSMKLTAPPFATRKARSLLGPIALAPSSEQGPPTLRATPTLHLPTAGSDLSNLFAMEEAEAVLRAEVLWIRGSR